MTTNKPTTYWAPSTALSKLESRHNNAAVILTDTPGEFNDVALVRLADYEALQAAHEEELFCVRQDRDGHFGELMRALEQVDVMKAECERLRKLHQDAYQRGFHEGSMGLREAYDAIQEVKRQDAWGNAQLTEALLAAEDRAERVEIENAALTAENERLHKAIRRLCNIYVVDDYYSGDLREERLNQAIDAAMQEDDHDNQ